MMTILEEAKHSSGANGTQAGNIVPQVSDWVMRFFSGARCSAQPLRAPHQPKANGSFATIVPFASHTGDGEIGCLATAKAICWMTELASLPSLVYCGQLHF